MNGDLLVRDVGLTDGRHGQDDLALGGRIAAVGARLAAPEDIACLEGIALWGELKPPALAALELPGRPATTGWIRAH